MDESTAIPPLLFVQLHPPPGDRGPLAPPPVSEVKGHYRPYKKTSDISKNHTSPSKKKEKDNFSRKKQIINFTNLATCIREYKCMHTYFYIHLYTKKKTKILMKSVNTFSKEI